VLCFLELLSNHHLQKTSVEKKTHAPFAEEAQEDAPAQQISDGLHRRREVRGGARPSVEGFVVCFSGEESR